jgi:hypothetical protein
MKFVPSARSRPNALPVEIQQNPRDSGDFSRMMFFCHIVPSTGQNSPIRQIWPPRMPPLRFIGWPLAESWPRQRGANKKPRAKARGFI